MEKAGMEKLIEVKKPEDIPEAYRNTPISLLLEYHNLSRPFEKYDNAQLLIGMCMDNRKSLHIPDNFAYIIRTGGANLRHSSFKVSYAIALGKISHLALIGHNNCGMVNLVSRKDEFIKGLVEIAGWDKDLAEEHFMDFAPIYEISNEIEFLKREAKRLRIRYPKIQVAPMLYRLDENRLYLIKE
jgi:carbonic anhydrase